MHPLRHTLLRRLVIFSVALAILGSAGLGLLLFRWWGARGAPPTGRLYVPGDFAGPAALVTLQRAPSEAGVTCYSVAVAGLAHDAGPVCRGKAIRLWVEDALLDLSVGARGVPRVSIAGLRARPGDWLGSLADPHRPHPRFPLRADGVPALAARVVPCPTSPPGETASCLEIHDRLGRLAIARSSSGRVEVPTPGQVVRLAAGDALWLGLVAFTVGFETAPTPGPVLVLDRIDRLRSDRGGDAPLATALGGDRRWLGRLWPAAAPDPAVEVPERFEVYPIKARYTPYNLSRQRTNLEGEDVLQRLIDGAWLCLSSSSDHGDGSPPSPRIVWRPLDEPGCDGTRPPGGLDPSSIEAYRRARFGDLAFLARSLIETTDAALAQRRYLEDATTVPLVFDWRLSYGAAGAAKSARRLPQPIPRRLWGVRFGASRQVRRSAESRRGLLPTVLPRDSTARHLIQVLLGEELRASFYLPASATRGAICLGRHIDSPADSLMPYRPTSGSHYPLGSVAFLDDPQIGTWSADAAAACQGCQLELRPAPSDSGSLVTLTASGRCADLARPAPDPTSDPAGPLRLAPGDELGWGTYRLRYAARGQRPWLAATDPGTRRRHFAEEFYLRGRLRPLLGDAAALSGVEAALREYLSDAGEIGLPASLENLELTIDGDLQIAAAAIVDALARPQIAGDDPEPHRVSVTAAILDAHEGDLLAAVNWSSNGSDHARRGEWLRPTTWELGSGQADVLENAALLRRAAIGSTMKITGTYALLNNDGLNDAPELAGRRPRLAVLEAAGGGRGRLYIDRGGARERPNRRRCSTGPHYLPASEAGFSVATLVHRFAASCNNFFVISGFRHLSHLPARLSEPRHMPAEGARPQELFIDYSEPDRPKLVHPSASVHSVADRIRDGLRGDFASGSPPKSLFGILFSLGFQARPHLFPTPGEAPAELRFDHRGQPVVVPLINSWFSPAEDLATPALRPGRDFSYPGVPSPGRLDEAGRAAPATERYDDTVRRVVRLAEGRADVQYAMLMIGQSSVEASALGLATLYAPAARPDGKAIRPCLFRANCGPARSGPPVVDTAKAEILHQALTSVLRIGTARGGLRRAGRQRLAARGWGGKTGTYQVERQRLVGLSPDRWSRLRSWACGVDGADRPTIRRDGSRVSELAASISQAAAGSALGARSCEDQDFPLNPGGVHGYRSGPMPSRLDELAHELERSAESETSIYHSFVALQPAAVGARQGGDSAARGLVIAVLVDRQTADKSIAIQIGAELAAAAERQCLVAR